MDHLEVFSTPILVSQLSDLEHMNPALAATLTKEASESPGVVRSNVGGWHSVPDLTQRFGAPFAPVMNRLAQEVSAAVNHLVTAREVTPLYTYRYGIHAWAMVMRKGDYTVPHDHASSHFSAVYYVDAGDDPTESHPHSGELVFKEPKTGSAMIPGLDLFHTAFSIRPRTGTFVLFPSYLLHYVHAYMGERPRVSLSLNVNLDPTGPTQADPGASASTT